VHVERYLNNNIFQEEAIVNKIKVCR